MDTQKPDRVTQCIYLFAPSGEEVTDVHFRLRGARKHSRVAGWVPPGRAAVLVGLTAPNARPRIIAAVQP